MARSKQSQQPLDTPNLAAADLRQVAGLTYRQLNEWDKRKMLPHQRRGDTGWRRVNAWQAMALRITSLLHREFGIPLVNLRPLLNWLIGEAPTGDDDMRILEAEEWLYSPTPQERAEHKKARLECLVRHTYDGRHLHLITLRPDVEIVADGSVRGAPGASTQELTKKVAVALAARLVGRGWDSEAAEDFARRFSSLSVQKSYGVGSVPELRALESDAIQADDSIAVAAVQWLGYALLPISGALAAMATGFPVFLVTDLMASQFLTEPALVDAIRQGILRKRTLHVEVSGDMNAVLESLGKAPIPVSLRARDVESTDHGGPGDAEDHMLRLLRERDFDRLIIEPREGRFRVVRERYLAFTDEEQLAQLLEGHDYVSVTAVKRDGKLERVRQHVSEMIPPIPDDGKPSDTPGLG